MRYLFLTPDFPPDEGGVQTLLATLAEGLAARNEVTVVAPAAVGAHEYDLRQRYGVRRYPKRRSKLAKLVALARAALPAAADADVVFCGHIAAGPAAWFLARRFRKGFFIYVHGMEITSAKYRTLFRFLLGQADGIVTGSSYGRYLIASYFDGAALDVEVIPPAVSPALARAAREAAEPPRLKRPGEKVILSVGRLAGSERYKGHDVVIAALPLIQRCVPRCSYWLVGAGDDAVRLRALARDGGVLDDVKFWGRVADVAPFYRECDIFVMPSRQLVEDGIEKGEGFGLVFLEASLFGKPVIAGRCAGALDAVIDGETGFLVDAENPAAVAAAVVALLTSTAEAKRMGQAGRARVLRDFTVARQVGRLEAAIAKQLAGPKGGYDVTGEGIIRRARNGRRRRRTKSPGVRRGPRP